MREFVEKWIEKRNQEIEAEKDAQITVEKQEKQKEREKVLLKNGFFVKEYGETADFPHLEADPAGGVRHYKKVPIALTDEEWEQVYPLFKNKEGIVLIEEKESTEQEKQYSYSLSNFFTVSGIISLVGGFIGAVILFIMGMTTAGGILMGGSAVEGILCFALAKILELLTDLCVFAQKKDKQE